MGGQETPVMWEGREPGEGEDKETGEWGGQGNQQGDREGIRAKYIILCSSIKF